MICILSWDVTNILQTIIIINFGLPFPEFSGNLAWVGSQEIHSTASLRASNSNIMPDLPQEPHCLDGDSNTCYFLEVGGSEVEPIKRCQAVKNTAPAGPAQVDQCDQEVNQFFGNYKLVPKLLTPISR